MDVFRAYKLPSVRGGKKLILSGFLPINKAEKKIVNGFTDWTIVRTRRLNMISSTASISNMVTERYHSGKATQTRKATTEKTDKAASAKETAATGTQNLSAKAKAVLEKLKNKYANMDFFVADYSSDEEAQNIMSAGTKEYSALLSSDELEKMAEDEDYLNGRMGDIDNAIDTMKRIKEQFRADKTDGNENGVTSDDIVRLGVTFNADGTTSYFAQLEKSAAKQKEWIDANLEKKAEEKKKAEKEGKEEKQQNVVTKKTTVQASSYDELIEKLKQVDWSEIKDEPVERVGGKLDLSV